MVRNQCRRNETHESVSPILRKAHSNMLVFTIQSKRQHMRPRFPQHPLPARGANQHQAALNKLRSRDSLLSVPYLCQALKYTRSLRLGDTFPYTRSRLSLLYLRFLHSFPPWTLYNLLPQYV